MLKLEQITICVHDDYSTNSSIPKIKPSWNWDCGGSIDHLRLVLGHHCPFRSLRGLLLPLEQGLVEAKGICSEPCINLPGSLQGTISRKKSISPLTASLDFRGALEVTKHTQPITEARKRVTLRGHVPPLP